MRKIDKLLVGTWSGINRFQLGIRTAVDRPFGEQVAAERGPSYPGRGHRCRLHDLAACRACQTAGGFPLRCFRA